MFLKNECDELGKWFNDTYPLYTLDFRWERVADKKTGRPGETYEYILSGPAGFKPKHTALLLTFNGYEEAVQATFLSKMQRAISEAINPPEIEMKEYQIRVSE